MKKLTLWLGLLAFATGLYAQAETSAIQAATDEAAALYQLDEEQAKQMYQVQERRFRNLASIEQLKASDYSLYLRKRENVRQGTLAAVKRILQESQMAIFNQQLAERRQEEAALTRRLKEEGASREEIRTALLELN